MSFCCSRKNKAAVQGRSEIAAHVRCSSTEAHLSKRRSLILRALAWRLGRRAIPVDKARPLSKRYNLESDFLRSTSPAARRYVAQNVVSGRFQMSGPFLQT